MAENRRNPLFMRFLNKEVGVADLLSAYTQSPDSLTVSTAEKALLNPPDLMAFRGELLEAVHDIIHGGVGQEFIAFVNNYMQPSLDEDVSTSPSQLGEDMSRSARVKDPDTPWVQGMLCYNLCLYIKAFGLENLKCCKVCGKFFDHKGKYAVYCNDKCKTSAKAPKTL